MSSSIPTLPKGYILHDEPPSATAYLALRTLSGLSPKTSEQASGALAGSWDFCHIVHEASSTTVGMGRTIGDGGWYFHIADMAVLPEHQRKGLGDVIMARLVGRIRQRAPPGAYVTLLADVPGRRLYERHGFEETGPTSIGMARLS
ncbi:hypothetical protein W97_06579 [Coniosporium apollinis CBS 100218]|uniref:N-acetyltransferase domain-containing protein n=1 Tax=Coniosporium apollinis (strain CBS 100218) TaxID=1168221 RepID=R7Z073_CONA1|nr:uncharacterized protein W97_06579 [Coniosporium apollinis CBS 100218]EON67326.1 hypothetical protein W97_06579 [Coniosporium apollinis CBS 100218]